MSKSKTSAFNRVGTRSANPPADVQVLLGQAQALYQAGRAAEARLLCQRVLNDMPSSVDALFLLGLIAFQSGHLPEAIEHLQSGARLSPQYPQLKSLLGTVLAQAGALDAALVALREAVSMNAQDVGALTNLGLIYANQQRMSVAADTFRQALRIQPNDPGLHSNLGNACLMLEQSQEAETAFNQAIRLAPDYAPAVAGLGGALCQQERFEEALTILRPLTEKFPDYAGGWCNLGLALKDTHRFDEALTCLARALSLAPEMSEALSNQGLVLTELKRFKEALDVYERALQSNPANSEALNNLGLLYTELKQYPQAFACFDQVIQVNPSNARFLSNRGLAAYEAGCFEDARDYLSRAFAANRQLAFVYDALLLARQKLCDWSADPAEVNDFLARVERGEVASTPLPLLAIHSTKAQQQAAAQGTCETMFVPDKPLRDDVQPRSMPNRIGVAYLSADYHEHATAYLMAELFESHDRAHFEVIGICHGRYGGQEDDPMRQRIRRAFDAFHEVAELSDQAVAELIHTLNVDVLVDLKGHTKETRMGILAYRPAPVQIHYLGYPGTLGAPFVDYLVADSVLVPEDHRCWYSEKMIYLPDTYQVNDAKRTISEKTPTRAELGLPEQGFVFCCFNNNYKITPDAFDSWMRILKAVPDSVLWLYQDNAQAAENLKAEAIKRDVDPARLVFAKKVPLTEHLARHRAADLFLDTFYYGAHTTASDAIWVGLPVLTKLGDTFASRVAASLLHALDVPELVTRSVEEYEALAIELAKSPERLKALRHKVLENRATSPLFDTQRFVRNLERAYVLSMERYTAGLAPDHLIVDAA